MPPPKTLEWELLGNGYQFCSGTSMFVVVVPGWVLGGV